MKALFVVVVVLLVVLLVPALGLASTWLVKPDGTGDWPTIQAAVNAAASYDTILLADGTFVGAGNREVGFMGKQLVIASQNGDPSNCIIDCEGAGRGFRIVFPDYRSKVVGLTIINGVGLNPTYGGGIWVNGGFPEIINCVISNCRAETGGGGICFMYTGQALVQDCLVAGNSAGLGGGMMLQSTDSEIINSTITGNQSQSGGGIYLSGGNPRIKESLVVENVATYGGGIFGYYATPTLVNCTIAYNNGHGIFAGSGFWHIGSTIIASNAGFGIYNPVSVILTCSDIWGNSSGDWVGAIAGQLVVPGNICQDPMFCLPEYTIDLASPCTVENSQGCGLIGALGVGCERPTGVEGATWGKIKALYK